MMQIFCKYVWLVLLILAMSSTLSLADIMDRRQDNIGVQEIYGSYGNGPFTFGVVNKSPNFVDEHCVGGSDGDWALEFNISSLKNSFPLNFDVNNIYIDGTNLSGEIALGAMKKISKHDNGTQKLMSLQHGHWGNNKVSFCVGGAMQLVASEYVLENKIYLWYKEDEVSKLYNLLANDICTADGNNWMQKLLEGFLGGISNSAFCANPNNKADMEFNTQNNTATLKSKVPLKSNGAKSVTISFSQAGVSSAQVKAGIGFSSGGAWQTNPGGSGTNYGNDPHTPSADVHINHLKIRREDQSNYHTESGAFLNPGQSVAVYAEGRIENRSSDNCDYVRMEYCVTTKKKFRHAEKKDLDYDVLDSDEREHDFDPGEKISKSMRRTIITLASDMEEITVSTEGRYSHTFPILEKHRYEKKVPLYFWLDVKVNIGSLEDRDISCNQGSGCDEYGKFEVALPYFSSSFKADTILGEAPLGVLFEETAEASEGAIISYHWDFGDGTTSNEENPIHVYEDAGTYTARLTTTASWGETKTSQSKVVTVLEEEGLSVAEKMNILW